MKKIKQAKQRPQPSKVVCKTRHYNGIPMRLVQPKGRVRTLGADRPSLKVGHGCVVQVGMIEFHSMYTAKRFIKALANASLEVNHD